MCAREFALVSLIWLLSSGPLLGVDSRSVGSVREFGARDQTSGGLSQLSGTKTQLHGARGLIAKERNDERIYYRYFDWLGG